VHVLPVRPRGSTRLHQGLGALACRPVRLGRLAGGEAFWRLRQGLRRLSQPTADGQRIALDEVREEMKDSRETQALHARFGQFEQRLCPLTHQGEPPDAQGLQPRRDQRVPRGITTLLCHLFAYQRPADQVQAPQHQACQAGFVHRPDDRAGLAMGYPRLLPSGGRLHNRLLHAVHHPS
jgi:hypothetical protein